MVETPKIRTCAAPEIQQRLLQSPQFQARMRTMEAYTAKFTRAAGSFRMAGTFNIPVVVHVVYDDDAGNLSDAQIESQIAVLNEDYQATNTDVANVPEVWTGLVGNARVEFALATKDPDGKATNGITRTQTKVPAFGANDAVKSAATGGADPWPSDRYLNLWVCTLSGGLLGYAQFPGGPPETDGVVILSTAFGTGGTATAPFNLGRTATHEVGHWLNLHHIWGDALGCTGNDLVNDTPVATGPNYGTPTFPHVTCDNGPSGDMFMNYMDYVDDAVMVMFTAGQVARMTATLAGPRASVAGLSEDAVVGASFAVVGEASIERAPALPEWRGWPDHDE